MAATPMTIGSGRATVRLLPDFALERDGERIEVAPSAQRVIGFLAVQSAPQARRGFVSAALWPDSPESRGQASLRSALWRGPVVDGAPVIRASPTRLWLDPAVDVDVRVAAARAKKLLGLRLAELGSIDVLQEASAFGDDLLVGWYEEWADAERERFRQLRLHVLDRLGELLLQGEDYAGAVEVGLIALLSDSLRESAHRLLVRAHLGEGNLAEAVRQYRSYASLLARELGIRPSGAMEELIGAAVGEAGIPRRTGAPVAARTRG